MDTARYMAMVTTLLAVTLWLVGNVRQVFQNNDDAD